MLKTKKKEVLKKIVLILIVVLIILTHFQKVYALGANNGLGNLLARAIRTSIITKPACRFIMNIADTVNTLITAATYSWASDELDDEGNNFIEKIINQYQDRYLSVEQIFMSSGDDARVQLVNVNIFKDRTSVLNNGVVRLGVDGFIMSIREGVRELYLVVRNICAIIMLSILIYIGIRLILSANSAQEQAKWKERIMDWLKGLILVVFMHFVLVGSMELVDMITHAISEFFEGTISSVSILAEIRKNFILEEFFSIDEVGIIITTILYCYVTYMTIVFLVAYMKRFMYMMVMIVIAPVFGALYGIGQIGKQRFQKFMREYFSGLMVQPFHLFVYTILVLLPLKTMGIGASGFLNWITGEGMLFKYIYILIAIGMIRPIEKFVRSLFGFSGTMLDNVASFESGKKTINQGVKVAKAGVEWVKHKVEQAVQIGVTVARAAAGDPTALMGGMPGGMPGGDPGAMIPGGGPGGPGGGPLGGLGGDGNNPFGGLFGEGDPNNPMGGLFGQEDPNNPMGGLFGGDQFIGGINSFNPMDDTFGLGRPFNAEDADNPMYNRQGGLLGGITTSGPINIYGNGINDMGQDGVPGIGVGTETIGPEVPLDENGEPIVVDTGAEEPRAEFDEN